MIRQHWLINLWNDWSLWKRCDCLFAVSWPKKKKRVEKPWRNYNGFTPEREHAWGVLRCSLVYGWRLCWSWRLETWDVVLHFSYFIAFIIFSCTSEPARNKYGYRIHEGNDRHYLQRQTALLFITNVLVLIIMNMGLGAFLNMQWSPRVFALGVRYHILWARTYTCAWIIYVCRTRQ